MVKILVWNWIIPLGGGTLIGANIHPWWAAMLLALICGGIYGEITYRLGKKGWL